MMRVVSSWGCCCWNTRCFYTHKMLLVLSKHKHSCKFSEEIRWVAYLAKIAHWSPRRGQFSTRFDMSPQFTLSRLFDLWASVRNGKSQLSCSPPHSLLNTHYLLSSLLEWCFDSLNKSNKTNRNRMGTPTRTYVVTVRATWVVGGDSELFVYFQSF